MNPKSWNDLWYPYLRRTVLPVFQEPAESMVAGLSLRALANFIKNDDMSGLKGFLVNKHVQVIYTDFR